MMTSRLKPLANLVITQEAKKKKKKLGLVGKKKKKFISLWLDEQVPGRAELEPLVSFFFFFLLFTIFHVKKKKKEVYLLYSRHFVDMQ